MSSINLNNFDLIKDLQLDFRDLRKASHPEYGNFEDIRQHVKNAFKKNGLRFYGASIFEEVIRKDGKMTPINLYRHLRHLVGDARRVINFTRQHRKSSYSRYKSYRYETLPLLQKSVFVKKDGQICLAKNGIQRTDLINSVDNMVAGIERPKVLEAGCGSGLNIYLLNALNKDIEIHGFEYTNARVASCIANLFYHDIINNIFLADVTELNLPDNSYDVVFSYHVLEQLGQEQAEKALSEMLRVSRRGIVLSEPSTHGANFYEKWRMKKLGYCQDLLKAAEKLPNARVLTHREDTYRSYPNTSHHLVIKKTKS